jgi:hypothetical protein
VDRDGWRCHPEQRVPFRRKAVGGALLFVQVPWNPKLVLEPGPIVGFELVLTAVTLAPFCVTVAFQELVIRSSPGNVNVTVQPLIAELPVL